MKRKDFPCPVCKGTGVLEEGHYVDVEVGMIQVSADLECDWCTNGMMVIDSPKHRQYAFDRWMEKSPQFIWDGEDITFLDALKNATDYLVSSEASIKPKG